MDNLEAIQARITELQSQLEAAKQERRPKARRIFHLQVGGSPSMADLKAVADAFNTALLSGTDAAVPTNIQVQSRTFFIGPNEPIDSLVVKAALDLEAVAAVVYEMLEAYDMEYSVAQTQKSKLQWPSLDEKTKLKFVSEIADYLHYKKVPESLVGLRATLAVAVLKSLVQHLPVPDEEAQSLVDLAIEVNKDANWIKWKTIRLQQLRPGHIFRFRKGEDKAYVVTGHPFVNYAVPQGAAYSVACNPLDAEQFPLYPDWIDPQIQVPAPVDGTKEPQDSPPAVPQFKSGLAPSAGPSPEETMSASMAQAADPEPVIEQETQPSDLARFYADAKGDVDVNVPTREPANAQDQSDLDGTLQFSGSRPDPDDKSDRRNHVDGWTPD
jgi:hypothetical protein